MTTMTEFWSQLDLAARTGDHTDLSHIQAACQKGKEMGAAFPTDHPDFKGAWNWCDELGFERGSAECEFFTDGFLETVEA